MDKFSPLGHEMAQIAGRLGTIDAAVSDRVALEWMVSSGHRLASFGVAQAAWATGHLERLIRDEYSEALRNGSGPPASADPDPSSDGETSDGDTLSDASASDAPAGGGRGASGRVESGEEFAARLRRSTWLGRCPLFGTALQSGAISVEIVDVLAVVLDGVEPTVVADVLADEERLVEVARRMARTAFARYLNDVIDRVRADGGMSRFERQLRKAFASFKPDDVTGMYRLFAEIDPVRGAAMLDAVQRRVDELYQTAGATDGRSRGQITLQALHDLICRDLADGDVGGGGAEILVVCDSQTFLFGEHPETVCETSEGIRLPVSFLTDMCAEAMLSVAVAGADGRVLKVGSAQRLANREQRRALRAMYRRCAHPGCTVPFPQCRIHHVIPWQQQGPTDLENLVPLCFKHHHLVHEGGWRLTIDAARTLRWYRPGGELHVTDPFIPLLRTATQSAVTSGRGSAATVGRSAVSPMGPAPPPGTPADPPCALRLFDLAAS